MQNSYSNPIQLLDCTLRDGGYINDWKWGFDEARSIIALLIKAGVDVVEVGFLRNIENYSPEITVCNTIEELNRLLPENCEETVFAAMAMQSNYDIEKLVPYSGKGIEIIRVTSHDYDIDQGLEFAQKVKEKGYKVSINPINIMGYSDTQILRILEQVNCIQPYQFSIVDTFGSMKRRDLDRIVSIVDHNLNKDIRLALHLHENMSLSYSLAQNFVDKNLDRPIAIDGSLMGMGRIPGNLPIELIADYLNDYQHCAYDIDYMMDAIQDYIMPIRESSEWGYSPVYFLSAKFNLHRNYAEHYLKKGDLTTRDINHILSRFEETKASVFDKEYANEMYQEYKGNKVDDSVDRERLKTLLAERNILILAPGASLRQFGSKIEKYVQENHPVVIAVNFFYEDIPIDYIFFGNNRRYNQVSHDRSKIIVTSNILENADFRVDYNSIAGAYAQGCNSLILVLRLLKLIGIKSVMLAGVDGYSDETENYFSKNIKGVGLHDEKFNSDIKEALQNLRMDIGFLTPSKYSW